YLECRKAYPLPRCSTRALCQGEKQMNEQPKSLNEMIEEISQLELAEQPEAFSRLHDQLDLELNRTDSDNEAK
ncbi:MAG: hypothetical protein RLZZ556_592, partial [Actinomycetota bacterium]